MKIKLRWAVVFFVLFACALGLFSASFTNDWDESNPTNDTYGYYIDDWIRKNAVNIRERFGVDHATPFSGDTNAETGGFHTVVHVIDESTDPDTHAYGGSLYGKNGFAYWITGDGDVTRLDTTLQDNTVTETKLHSSVRLPYIYTAVGTSNISVDTDVYQDMDDMTISETFLTGKIYINFYATMTYDENVEKLYLKILVDDVEQIQSLNDPGANAVFSSTDGIQWSMDIEAGLHTIKIQWHNVSTSPGIQQYGEIYKRVLTIITGQ